MNKIIPIIIIAIVGSVVLSAQIPERGTGTDSLYVRDGFMTAGDSVTYISSQNPVFPSSSKLFIPDPEPYVFDGKLYVYGSMDEKKASRWCSDRYHVVYTEDLIHWKDAGVSFHLDSIPGKYRNASQNTLWAPDLIRNPKDGKYYLFLCTSGNRESTTRIYVAVSDKPEGPFTDAVPLLIDGETPVGHHADPAVMLDDDGKAYVTWPFKIAQLDPLDYTKVLGHTIVDVKQWMPESPRPYEGPSLRKRGNLYYYIYIQDNGSETSQRPAGRDQPTRMAYLTSENPMGPYTYRGLILNTTTYPNSINVHGSFVEFKENWYVFYHLPVIDKYITRTLCIDQMTFNSDGSINFVNITSSGANGPFRSGDKILSGSAVIWPDKKLRPEFRSREEKDPVIVFKSPDEWVGYRYVQFENDEDIEIQGSFRTNGNVGNIDIRLNSPNGPLFASFNVPDTEGEWQVLNANSFGKYTGRHSFYIVMTGNDEAGSVELEWIRFNTCKNDENLATGWSETMPAGDDRSAGDMDIFLLMGQSNMQGVGALPEDASPPDSQIFSMDMNSNAWIPAQHPLHNGSWWTKFGVGPGLFFGLEVRRNHPEKNIGLIPCAKGGSWIGLWQKTNKTTALDGKTLYNYAMDRAQLAKQYGTLRGIIWLQGESDADYESRAASYQANLSQLVEDFRTDLGMPDLPFVCATIGSFLTTDKRPYRDQINDILLNVSNTIPHAACANTLDITGHIGDKVHFNTDAQGQIGVRMAEEYLRLSQDKSENLINKKSN